MSDLHNSLSQYFRDTNSLLYSYLISLPLLLLYEVLIFISQPNSDQAVRISVDVWIKTLFAHFSNNVLSITLIIVALIGVVILYRERDRLSKLKPRYFFIMLIEAGLYAFLLALLLSVFITELLQIMQPTAIESLSALQKIALSLGAGLYEELFFRVILVSGLLFIFKYFISTQWIAYAAAMVIAALIFSWVHYIGAFGDPFALGSFLFRFLFGLALNAIYIWRGFGMAAWTHAIYDIMVVVYG